MTKDDKQSLAGFITLLGVVIAFLCLIGSCVNNEPGDAWCYNNLPAVYSWDHRRAELNEIWSDKQITAGECFVIREINDELDMKRMSNETQEKMQKMVPNAS